MDVNSFKTKFNDFWARNIATKPIILSTTERSDAERKMILEQKIILYVSRGWNLDTQTEFAAVLRHGKRLNHILHLLLSLVTFGFWILVWIFLGLVNRVSTLTITVDKFGNTSILNKKI
jgi:hypothetical protein